MEKNKRVFIMGLVGESFFLETEQLPKKGETIKTTNYREEIGGKGYNQALVLNKLGHPNYFLSTIGNDSGAKLVVDDFKKSNLKGDLLVKEDKTAFAFILTDKSGENIVNLYQGASLKLKVEDVIEKTNLIKDSKILSLQFEVPFSANLEAIGIALNCGTKIIINPAPYNPEYVPLLQFASIITPNEGEARKIFDLKDNESLELINERMQERNIKEVIVTIGKNGAMHFKDGIITKYDTIKINPVDTTGAGDSFNAMLCYALANDFDIDKAIIYSNICASLSTLEKGTKANTISLEKIENIYNTIMNEKMD